MKNSVTKTIPAPNSKPLRPMWEALKIALTYLVLGLLWITFSDRLVAAITSNMDTYRLLESYKGYFFVLVTAALVVALVRGLVARLKLHQDHLDELVAQRTAALEQAMQKHLEDEQELFRSRQLFQEVVENAPVGIYWKGLNGRYIGCNKLMAESLRTTVDNLLGQTNRAFMSEEDAAFYTQQDHEMVAYGIPRIHSQQMLITGTGERRMFNINKVVLYTSAHKAYAILGVVEDITEQKQQEMELVRAKHDANAANRAKSEFLSHMSHEIRTPLNSIIGLTHIASESDDPGRIKEYLDQVSTSSKHLLSIINDILDLSRIEAGKMSISSVDCDLITSIEEIVGIVLPRADEKRQTLNLYIDSELPRYVQSDPVRVKQVLMNLLTNAVKFTHEEGTITVRAQQIRTLENQVLVRFSVADNGIGIEEQALKRIFSPFEQADSTFTRIYEGTGLGLAISKEIVELMGGEIGVESKAGAGSTFFFTLPFHITETKPASIDIYFENLKVLVVDDEQETCTYMESLLNQFKIAAEAVQSGEEAVATVRQAVDGGNPFHVVFVDLRMPGMNGIETARLIKEISGENTIVIMFSMYELNDIESQARDAGVSLFMSKPIFPSKLLNTLYQITNGPMARTAPADIETQDIFSGKRILVAEDILVNQLIIREMLAKTGVVVVPVSDGRQAVDLVCEREERFDAVLMDIQMPVMDGLEATRRIRACAKPNAAKTPIIAMTANVFKEDIEKAMSAGMDAHIGKPVDAKELIAKLYKIICP